MSFATTGAPAAKEGTRIASGKGGGVSGLGTSPYGGAGPQAHASLDEGIEINILKFAYLKVLSPRLNSERLPGQPVAQISGFILSCDSSTEYSFGVVLLELITGRKPVGEFGDGVDIVRWVKKTISELVQWVPTNKHHKPVQDCHHLRRREAYDEGSRAHVRKASQIHVEIIRDNYFRLINSPLFVPVLFQHSLKELEEQRVANLDHIFGTEPVMIVTPSTDSEVALDFKFWKDVVCCTGRARCWIINTRQSRFEELKNMRAITLCP
ncbi:hypothetical protein RHMOL_Rhmol06G0031800 [Rhododendron molle]|uniref:Uncharacterized protein n=1 Tax=Rhododendron molle TaxID=49168 RepID=A0ACC0N9I8_RHOML|nr:hypothetical protein RHMOL_Rhmol06G0031800 [Rhododendron molle]